MMKYIKLILIIFVIASIGYLAVKEYAGPFVDNAKPQADSATVKTESVPDGVVMYYFYGNRRCPTCMAIERYSKEAAEPYISDGKLSWQEVNVEDAENKHFIYDFQLRSSGPVLVAHEGGAVKRWQPLVKAWQLVRNKEDFAKYMDDEIKRFF